MSPTPVAAPSRRTAPPTRGRGLSSVRPPRRVSGPAPGRRTTPPGPRRQLPRPVQAVARAAARVSRHPLVDRMISGRWSIALIAFSLIGIVTLQLGLLKLNVGVGRSLERERTLERENATLGIENAELASPERIRQLATRLGMSPVSLTELRFLKAPHDPGAAAGAAARLHAPVHPAGETAAGTTHASTEAGTEAASTGAPSTEAASTEAPSTTKATSSSGGEEQAREPEAHSTGAESQAATPSGGEAEASTSAPAETAEGG
jgi:cell division protein FtsL